MPVQAPWLHALTLIVFVLHISGGAVALASGTAAVIARKGGALHRRAGKAFVASMVLMAILALYLAVVIPGQLVNVFISLFSVYLIITGWLSVRRHGGSLGLPEKIALFVGACLCAPFAILSIQLALGLPPLFKSAVPFKGAVLIAIYAFTGVLAIATVGDARLVWGGKITGVARISRHLWRMCLGFTLALGSGFTNGFARLLPGPYHVPVAFFLPQFIPLLLIAYWLVRVRFSGQFKNI